MLTKLLHLLPESTFKNKIRCLGYNLNNPHFRISFRKNWTVIIDGIELYFQGNPYHLLLEQRAYFKYHDFKPGEVVVDGGGFWGTFALLVSKKVGDQGRVYVFEPDPDNHRQLQANIKLNGIKNIELIPRGLWSSSTTLSFQNKGDVGSTFFAEQGNDTIHVETTSLDSFFDDKPQRLNFIKMDIEGAEVEALRGAAQILKTLKPDVVIASYHLVEGQMTRDQVEILLKDYGYERVFTEDEGEVITYGVG